MKSIINSVFLQILIVILFSFLTGISACTAWEPENNGNLKNMNNHNNRVAGEYMIKLYKNSDINTINELFKAYGIKSITPAGDRLFKMKLEDDPGPEKVKEIADRSEKIEFAEPNYIYRINPPGKRGKLRDFRQ